MEDPELQETAPAESEGRSRDGQATQMVVRWVHPLPVATTTCVAAPLIVGRAGSPQLSGIKVSRRHAQLKRVADEVVLIDLDSRNGTFVNGEQVKEALLRAGDVVRLGDCVGVVEVLPTSCVEGFGHLGHGVFGGAALRAVVEQAKRVASSRLNVLVVGETGTGKERLAGIIHAESGRSGPLLSVNCAVYHESNAAGELFGFRKGAFTGAERSSLGHVRGAHRGTLFLDEVVDFPFELQPKLLRAIEQQEVLPLGETAPIAVDVRYVAAAQEDLAGVVRAGRFRADLRSRLEGIVLRLPPLRERRADIVPLFRALLERHADGPTPDLSSELVEQLCLHSWPMNVRELDNIARRLLILFRTEPRLGLSQWKQVFVSDPPSPSAAPSEAEPPVGRASAAPYSQEQLDALAQALERHRGNVSKAAEEIGITRPKAYRMLRAMQRPVRKQHAS